ncbi:Phosphate metabolism protein 7 [Fusarium oxysporum f. sp. albedinis]|nr:Phosphate metabolism protein 7 [Fusarium oxysporum f. sp. albedinis]
MSTCSLICVFPLSKCCTSGPVYQLDGAKPRRWLENPEESFYRNFVSLGVYLWSWGRNTETAEINCIDHNAENCRERDYATQGDRSVTSPQGAPLAVVQKNGLWLILLAAVREVDAPCWIRSYTMG